MLLGCKKLGEDFYCLTAGGHFNEIDRDFTKEKKEEIKNIYLTYRSQYMAPGYLKYLLENFPNMENLTFHLNNEIKYNTMWNLDDAIFRRLEEGYKPFNINMIFHIDESNWEYVKTRNQKAAIIQKPIDALIYCNKYSRKLDDSDKNITMKTFLRLDMSNGLVTRLLADNDIEYYFQYFDDLLEKFQSDCFTFEGFFFDKKHQSTKEDGKRFAEFIRQAKNLDDSKFTYLKHPFFEDFIKFTDNLDLKTMKKNFEHYENILSCLEEIGEIEVHTNIERLALALYSAAHDVWINPAIRAEYPLDTAEFNCKLFGNGALEELREYFRKYPKIGL